MNNKENMGENEHNLKGTEIIAKYKTYVSLRVS